MTASLHKLGSGREAGNYYIKDSAREANPSRRDEYYAKDGGGIWWSSGETIVHHGAAIDQGTFRDLCAGLHPVTHQPLVRGAGEGHQAGTDLTFSAPKGFSVLWAAGTPEQRAGLEAIQRAAVDDALRFLLDEELVVVRQGAGGRDKSVPTDLIVGRFEHFTSRGGDPQCHHHCTVMNVAAAPRGSARYRGTHLTTDPERLFRHILMVGAAYRSALASRLVGQGFTLRPAGKGQFEIAGLPDRLLDAFSKRSADIAGHAGPNASPAQKAIATLATRGAKEDLPTGLELEQRWREELAEVGVDPWEAALHPEHHAAPEEERYPRYLDPPEIPGDTPVAKAASALFRHLNVIDRKSLFERALVEASLQGRSIAEVRAEIADLETNGTLLRLNDDRLDDRWTTPAIAEVEAALLRAADRSDERDWISTAALGQALAAAPHLTDEQRDAVWHAAGRGAISIIEAGAGTGKTTVAAVLVDAARRSGLDVVGLAPSWVAADELGRSIGIESAAIAKWRQDRLAGKNEPLGPRKILIVDEAGMVSSRDMRAVIEGAGEAKLVLLGDRRQLGSVAGASALRAVHDVVGRRATMRQVRRQQVDWQRAASILMARGEVEAGLRAYSSRGAIELVSGQEQAQAHVIERWSQLRADHGDDALIITRRNRDATLLNKAAREALQVEGRLALIEFEVVANDREGRAGNLALSVGDRIRFGETLPHFRIRNGTRATVERIGHDPGGSIRLAVRLEDGRVIDDKYLAFTREHRGRVVPPRISYAYAGTVYSVQGRTANTAILYVATPSDARELYVGLTRHQLNATLVVERDRLEAALRARAGPTKSAVSEAMLYERFFAEARHYAEKSNVVDFIEDRSAFVRSGIVPPGRLERVLDVSSAFKAGRALRSVLQEFGVVPRLSLWQIPHIVSNFKQLVPDRIQQIMRVCLGRFGRAPEPPARFQDARSGSDLSR